MTKHDESLKKQARAFLNARRKDRWASYFTPKQQQQQTVPPLLRGMGKEGEQVLVARVPNARDEHNADKPRQVAFKHLIALWLGLHVPVDTKANVRVLALLDVLQDL